MVKLVSILIVMKRVKPWKSDCVAPAYVLSKSTKHIEKRKHVLKQDDTGTEGVLVISDKDTKKVKIGNSD